VDGPALAKAPASAYFAARLRTRRKKLPETKRRTMAKTGPVPQPGILERVQAIAVGVLGGIPTITNCLSRCGELGLSKDAAEAIVDSMVERMRNWPDMFRVHGVPETTIARLRSAFAPILSGEDNRAAR